MQTVNNDFGGLQYLVVPLNSTDSENNCDRVRAVQGYAIWIFSDPQVRRIVETLKWAVMPVKISEMAENIVNEMACARRAVHP